MKKIKCNAIFIDLNNEKQVKWVLKMKKIRLIKVEDCRYDSEHDGVVTMFSSPIKSYIIWRNNRFLGEDLITVAYSTSRE